MTISTSTWTRTGVFDPGYLRDHFAAGFQRLTPVYPMVFRVEATTRRVERSANFGGMQAWGTKTEGASISFQTPAEGYTDQL